MIHEVIKQTDILHKYFLDNDVSMLEIVYKIENIFDPVQPIINNDRIKCGYCNGRIRNKRRAKNSNFCDKCGKEIDWRDVK